MMMHKRTFLKTTAWLSISTLLGKTTQATQLLNIATTPATKAVLPTASPAGIAEFSLPPLPYPTDALEPHFDKATMELHHGKHHAAYVKNLNDAVKGTAFEGLGLEEILKKVSAKDPKIRNNAGGHYNHSLFWQSLSPTAQATEPSKELLAIINQHFGSLAQLKDAFNTAAKGVFGSGWVWLMTNSKGDMWIHTTPNQDNHLMRRLSKQRNGTALLLLDVWEHAYYLKYQNKRADYSDAFWKVVNWQAVQARM